jgi:type IV pilus biogenesis protein CpaD/CtpE
MKPFRHLLSALLLLVAACASTGSTTGSTRSPYDALTAEDIASTGTNTAYDAISRLQPGWLQAARSGQVAIFVNGTPAGGVNFLHQIPASQVSEARFLNQRSLRAELSPTQAEGLTGAILIRTARIRP